MVQNLVPTDAPLMLMGGLAVYLLIANLLAYLAFVLDKGRAVRGEWRIAETTLLTLALLGGWPGAKLAQWRFRHKTRKQPFRTMLNLSGLVLPGVVLAFVVLVHLPQAHAVTEQMLAQVLASSRQTAEPDSAEAVEPAAFRPKAAGKWVSARPKP